MIIHLELAPDVEAQLRADAARHDAEAVQRLLTEALRPVVETTVAALLRDPAYGMERRADGLTDMEFDTLADELATMEPALPTLSNEAVSRAGIYEDDI
ncbi:MAG: hypothetical protein MI924_19495 [Chloroflexales bacterium]|nr:hypothetical protein [Chloroflexales bacterium]